MPPDYNDLPVPKVVGGNENFESNKIKELVTNDTNEKDKIKDPNQNFEDSLLEKIKK